MCETETYEARHAEKDGILWVMEGGRGEGTRGEREREKWVGGEREKWGRGREMEKKERKEDLLVSQEGREWVGGACFLKGQNRPLQPQTRFLWVTR